MAEPLTKGTVVGETWEVEELIGRGGMGEVWRAHHLRVEGKHGAIKVLRSPGAPGSGLVERFKREAEIAAQIEHPNIVQVFDFSTLPTGEPYIVMELLRGQSLKQRLARGPLSMAELRPLVVQLCSALHVAHAHGVVHRDLKPDNLFLVPTPTGDQLKVLDFGISKLVDSDTVHTSDSVLIGTPRYMSPEQAMGENTTLTSRSDVFAVATICYEALEGRSPFRADGLAKIVHRIVYEEPPDIADVEPQVMGALRRAMMKNPAQRTPDVSTFAAEFTGAAPLSGATPLASSQDSTRETRRPPDVRPAPAAPFPVAPTGKRTPGPRVAVGLALIAGLGLTGWLIARPAPSPVLAIAPAVVQPSTPTLDAGQVAAVVAVVPAAVEDAGPRPAPRAVRPAPEPALDEDQLALLAQVDRAFAAERFDEVLALTVKPAVANTHRAATLRLMAACAVGNLGLANATRARVPVAERGATKQYCLSRGMDLP